MAVAEGPGLVDTNVLVYRFDSRFPDKQDRAREFLARGIAERWLKVPHQAIVELMATLPRPTRTGVPGEPPGPPILPRDEALRETEELLTQLDVLYPDEAVLRTALRGVTAYQLSWFDAHLWAFAEVFGLPRLYSEDFQHGRYYGTVKVIDPFLEGEMVMEDPGS